MEFNGKIILPIVLVAIVGGLFFLNQKKHSFEPAPTQLEAIAQISSAVGKVNFLPKPNAPGLDTLDFPEKIYHGSELKTFTGSNVQITIDDGWAIDINAGTHLQFQSWGQGSEAKVLLHFYQGGYEVVNSGLSNNLLILYKGDFYAINENFNDKISLAMEINALNLKDKAEQELKDEEMPDSASNPLNSNEKSTRYIETSIFKKRNLFEKCLANRVRDHRMVSGRILVGFSVTEMGSLKDINIIENKTQDKKIETCIIDVFSRIKIRNYDGGKTFFAFPLDFK